MRTEPIRALMIGAHPDDCDWKSGGLAAKYVAKGHKVKFISATNGGAGHQCKDRPAVAERRRAEAKRVAELAGIEYEVLDIPDGCIQPDLTTRERFISLIRQFDPDLIFTHRTNDYHPDHRITGQLVMDSSYLIRVPVISPYVPPMRKNPVILYMNDHFKKPIPIQPDVVVGIDEVMDIKVKMLHCHTSQFYEWMPWMDLSEDKTPKTDEERLRWQGEMTWAREIALADQYRAKIVERYGEAGKSIKTVEVYEVSEYGRWLPPEEIDEWFPR